MPVQLFHTAPATRRQRRQPRLDFQRTSQARAARRASVAHAPVLLPHQAQQARPRRVLTLGRYVKNACGRLYKRWRLTSCAQVLSNPSFYGNPPGNSSIDPWVISHVSGSGPGCEFRNDAYSIADMGGYWGDPAYV